MVFVAHGPKHYTLIRVGITPRKKLGAGLMQRTIKHTSAPCSPETEQAVLGCCVATPAAFRTTAAMIGNRQGAFFENNHAEIWTALELWYADHDTAPDGAYLASKLFDTVGMDYISKDVINARCLPVNIEYHVGELLRLWKLRTARDTAATIARCADAQDLEGMEAVLTDLNAGMSEVEMTSPLNPQAVIDAPIPAPPVFNGGIVPGNMGILAAVDGAGKSFLCLSLALNIATGKPVIPSFRARQHGKVMFVSYEDAPGNIRFRLNAIAEQAGISTDIFDSINFYFPDDPLFVPNKAGMIDPTALYHALDAEAAKVCPDLIIIDPYSGASAAPENNNEMGAAIGQYLTVLARKHDTAVLVLHHVGKGQVDSESHLAMRGNSGLPSKARWIARLLSTDTENRLRLHVAKDSYHRRMSDVYFERTTAGPLREITGIEIGKARESLSESVVSFVGAHPEHAITLNAIRLNNSPAAKELIAALGASPAETFKAAEYAVIDGRLLQETRNRPNRGGTYDVLILADEEDPSEVPF